MKPSISEKFLIFIILFACIGEFMTLDLHLPNMPDMAKSFNTTYFMVQLVFILSFIESWVSQLVWGQIADSYGRRKVAILSMIIALIGQFGCMIAPSIGLLLFFRCIQYLFVGGMWVSLIGVIVDTFKNEEKRAKVFSLFDLLFPITITISPIIGAFLGSYLGWRGNFVFLFIIQFIAFILIYLFLPETLHKKSNLNLKSAIKDFKEIFGNHKVMSINICLSFLFVPFIIFTVHSSYIFIEYYGFTQREFSFYQSIPMFILFISSLLYNLIINKIHAKVAIRIGMLSLIIFMMLMFFIIIKVIDISALNFTLFMGFVAFANSFVRPSLETKLFSFFPEKTATLNGVIMFSFSLIVGSITTICAKMFDGAPKHVVLWLFITSFSSVVFFMLYKKCK